MLDDPRVTLVQFSEALFPCDDGNAGLDIEGALPPADVRDRHALERLARRHLDARVSPAEAVIVCLGVRLGATDDLAGALTLDGAVDATFTSRDTREASRRRGRGALLMATGLVHSGLLLGLSVRAEAGRTPCHHPLVFGLVGGVLGWSSRGAAAAYLQASVSAIAHVAARRGPLGPEDARRVLWSLEDEIARLAGNAAAAEALAVWSYALNAEAGLPH